MKVWAMTDKGLSRSQNQDSFFVDVLHGDGQAILVVCDGMGGARAGNVASAIAVETFIEEAKGALRSGAGKKQLETVAVGAVSAANESVYAKSRSAGGEYRGMGTTLVGALCSERICSIVNVGDSRAYLITAENGIRRVTTDHSVVEDLVSRGDISEAQARHHPNKNLITRALGTEPKVLCDHFSLELRPGNYLLLCSDGLSNMVEDQEMLFEVLHGGDLSTCCQRLIDIANERGGPDNITVALLSI